MAAAVMVKEPVAAVGVAPNVTVVFAPGAVLKGLAGLEMTPLGRPMSEIWTGLVKPFWAFTETLTGRLVPPWETDKEFEERAMEKSAGGIEVGAVCAEPPPQPLMARKRKARINAEAAENTGVTEEEGEDGMVRRVETRRVHKRRRGCGVWWKAGGCDDGTI